MAAHKAKNNRLLSKLSWPDFLCVILLILFDLSIHPLTGGPDRLIHDPAVYRLNDPTYMPGDWYTGMAVASGVYVFYAKLIGLGPTLGLSEELWRNILYLGSLAVLYYSFVRIARHFSAHVLVVPVLVVLHALISTGANQPVWLYGPFIQIDGGLAPRSIGMALSFLALYFLLRDRLVGAALILGLATLIHVSNSLIVFTLFFLAWALKTIWEKRASLKSEWRGSLQTAALAVCVYLLAGGWFAFYAAYQSGGIPSELTTQKFIWAWIYFRAPYMALPLVTKYWWLRLFAHAAAILGGWFLLRKRLAQDSLPALSLLGWVGGLSIVYFFLFYVFAFVWPWLPGFQFYSIRVLYLGYFVAYLFMALCLLTFGTAWMQAILRRLKVLSVRLVAWLTIVAVGAVLWLFSWKLGPTYRQPQLANLQRSWYQFLSSSNRWQGLVPENQRPQPLALGTLRYLVASPEPFLGPPNLKTEMSYVPNVASYKSFGFTPIGLHQWLERMNDVSRGALEGLYQTQQVAGRWEPVPYEWIEAYRTLTSDDVHLLAQKYNFNLFLASREQVYPFSIVKEDADFRLYKVRP